MSHREARRRRRPLRQLCAACQERKARYQYQGHVRADRTHVLCFQCFRAERERMRAWQLANDPQPLRPPARPNRTLTLIEIEHRRRMLAYQESLAAYASR